MTRALKRIIKYSEAAACSARKQNKPLRAPDTERRGEENSEAAFVTKTRRGKSIDKSVKGDLSSSAYQMSIFFSKGSFAAVASQVLWLAAFFAGLAACAVGIPYPQQHSAFALPAACAAGISTFNKLYLFCFAAISSCIMQASCVTLIIWIMGSRKRIDKLPQPSAVWCRRLLLVAVVFCGVSFSCIICVVDFFVFIRISRFGCLGLGAKFLVLAGDFVAAIWRMAIFTAGSYIALFCN